MQDSIGDTNAAQLPSNLRTPRATFLCAIQLCASECVFPHIGRFVLMLLVVSFEAQNYLSERVR